MLKLHPSKGRKLADLGVLLLLCSTAVYADTVYRCGEAYSTSSQCGHTAATELKPASVLSTGPSTNTSTHDLRDAQALEKQRLQAQRQAVQNAPVQMNAPMAQTPAAASHTSVTPHRQRPHSRKPASPYFTAIDPNHAKQKKKSTAKAVPADTTSAP